MASAVAEIDAARLARSRVSWRAASHRSVRPDRGTLAQCRAEVGPVRELYRCEARVSYGGSRRRSPQVARVAVGVHFVVEADHEVRGAAHVIAT